MFCINSRFFVSLIQESYSLVQESQQPQWNLVVLSHLRIIAGIDGVRIASNLVGGLGVADSELPVAVYRVEVILTSLVHLVVFPERVDEERFHHLLCIYLDRQAGGSGCASSPWMASLGNPVRLDKSC